MNKMIRWAKFIFMAPCLFLFMNGEGEAGEEGKAADAERQAAIDRGDIIPGAELDADALAAIAAEEVDEGKDEEKEERFIPKSRFNEVNEKAKAVTEENARLKAELEAARGKAEPTAEELAEQQRREEEERENPTTIAGMEAKRDALQLQADELLVEAGPQDEERIAILKQINTLNKDIAKQELRAETTTQMTQAEIARELSVVTSESLSLYPFLDNKSDKCDVDAVLSVRNRRFELEGQGIRPAEALRQAVEEKGPKFAKMLGYEVDQKKQAEVKAARDKAARETAADASMRQPPTPPAQSEKETFAINIDKLSDKQYEALPEHEKAKLRGDVL